MSAGIYLYNGILAYAKDLEKKIKRRKGAVIIEEYKGEGGDLEKELQKLLDKHTKISKPEPELETKPLMYSWKNKKTGWTHHSIYANLPPRYKEDEWERIK